MKKPEYFKILIALLFTGCSSHKISTLSAPIVSTPPRIDTASFSQNIEHLEKVIGNTTTRTERMKTLIDNIKVD